MFFFIIIAIIFYFYFLPDKKFILSSSFTHDEQKMIRQRYRYKKVKDTMWDVILIGSGPGSMACASSLAQIGKRCLILEQNEQLGGGAHVFNLNGVEFETGIHYLGKDDEMFKLIDFLSQKTISLSNIGTSSNGKLLYDNIIIDNKSYPFYSGKENLKQMLFERFPDDHNKINCYFALFEQSISQKVKNQSKLFFIIKSISYLSNYIKWKLIYLFCQNFYYFASHTVEEVLHDCNIALDSRLGSVLVSQYGDYGLLPSKACAMIHFGVMAHYINGSVYPNGGSSILVKRLNNVVIANNGNSFVHAKVSELIIKNNKCCGVIVNGDKIYGKNVVSGIGLHKSYALIKNNEEIEVLKKKIWANYEYSAAFTFMFVSLELPNGIQDKLGHNNWIYPEDNFEAMEKKIEENKPWTQSMPMFVASGSEKDKCWKHSNIKTIVVLTNAPYKWVKQWEHLTPKERKKNKDYCKYKELCKKNMMEEGFMKIYPYLKNYIKDVEIGTPLSSNNYLATMCGECYGQGMTPKKMLDLMYNPNTPIKHFYLTGQDIVSLGYLGSIYAGYLTANCLAGYTHLFKLIKNREIMKDIILKN